MAMFREDYLALFHDLQSLPSRTLSRKVNDVIKRAKRVRIHAKIMDALLRVHVSAELLQLDVAFLPRAKRRASGRPSSC